MQDDWRRLLSLLRVELDEVALENRKVQRILISYNAPEGTILREPLTHRMRGSGVLVEDRAWCQLRIHARDWERAEESLARQGRRLPTRVALWGIAVVREPQR